MAVLCVTVVLSAKSQLEHRRAIVMIIVIFKFLRRHLKVKRMAPADCRALNLFTFTLLKSSRLIVIMVVTVQTLNGIYFPAFPVNKLFPVAL